MATDKIKLHFACKNCGKLFTLSQPGELDEQTEFESMEAAMEVFFKWRDSNASTLFALCAGCKRAYQYGLGDIFIANPLSSQPDATSIIPPPPK